jgi:hypothetical protein
LKLNEAEAKAKAKAKTKAKAKANNLYFRFGFILGQSGYYYFLQVISLQNHTNFLGSYSQKFRRR